MTPLVTRLRNNQTARHLCGLAADEIERLQAALAECSAPYDTGPTTVAQGAALVAQEFQRRMDVAGVALSKVYPSGANTLGDAVRKARGGDAPPPNKQEFA